MNEYLIKTTLGELLDVLDARARVNIFIDNGELWRSCAVYHLFDSEYREYRNGYKVTGLSIVFGVVSINITKEA